MVKKLRDAGAIILAKVNLSEFASGGAYSSLGGQTLNPHDLTRTPSGSSGGTGASIAAGYATLGLGTDTGGSVRGPSTSNGIVGLKPTLGLLSRDGIIPLALSFDTGGPMARNVDDVAVALGVMTGVDAADAATKKSEGHFDTDYTKYLKADALKGARIGIARDFMGQDADVDWVVEASLAAMRAAGATIVDVRFPKWLLDAKGEFYNAVRYPEFPVQIAEYLATLKPGFPKTLDEMIERSDKIASTRPDGAGPNPPRWTLFKREAGSGTIDDYRYIAVHDHGLPLVRAAVDGVLVADQLDAIVYPTSSRRPELIAAPPDVPGGGAAIRIEPRQPLGLPRSRSCRPASPATACRWASRSSGRRSAKASCSRSATLRAGHQGPAPAVAHAGAAGRGTSDQVDEAVNRGAHAMTLATSYTVTLPSWVLSEVADAPLTTDAEKMVLVHRLARRNFREKTGGPFAALVVDSQSGELLAAGVNLVLASGLSSSHAEVVALGLAQAKTGHWDLGAGGAQRELVVNWRPCVQCYGAAMWSGVRRLVIAGDGPELERLTHFDEGPMSRIGPRSSRRAASPSCRMCCAQRRWPCFASTESGSPPATPSSTTRAAPARAARARSGYFFSVAPVSWAMPDKVVCAALRPSMKSLSENVAYRSVGWCQCGSHPLPMCTPRSFSRRLTAATSSMNGVESVLVMCGPTCAG